jgi:predicted MFS family arabinose efflux permease
VQYFNVHHWLGLAGWQLMLIAEGLPTLLWAGIWWMAARDRPREADWLTPPQAQAVEQTLEAEQRDVKQHKNYRAAFSDPQVILLCAQFFAWSIGIYGLNMWLPVILRSGSHFGMGRIGLLNAIPYLIGAGTMALVSRVSDRLLIRKHFVWPFMFIGAAAFGFSYLYADRFWLSFTGLIVAAVCMYAPYGPFWAMAPEMVSRNVVGESMALINTLGATGGFFGTFFVPVLHKHTGGYGVSFMFLALSLAAAGLLTLLVRTHGIRSFGQK